jgi:hypothetical protein
MRRKQSKRAGWTWKKSGVVLSTLVAAMSFVQEVPKTISTVSGLFAYNGSPVTYAQIESMRAVKRW